MSHLLGRDFFVWRRQKFILFRTLGLKLPKSFRVWRKSEKNCNQSIFLSESNFEDKLFAWTKVLFLGFHIQFSNAHCHRPTHSRAVFELLKVWVWKYTVKSFKKGGGDGNGDTLHESCWIAWVMLSCLSCSVLQEWLHGFYWVVRAGLSSVRLAELSELRKLGCVAWVLSDVSTAFIVSDSIV